jgi:hypothetical protein
LPAHCAAPTIIDFLKSELDKKLASLPTDRARINMLAKQYGVWTDNMRRFWHRHEQPFGGPHPIYGDMTAGDFLLVLGLIDGAKAKIERTRETA